jgi:hypothetical protein
MTFSSTSSSSSSLRSVAKNPCSISTHNGVQNVIAFICVVVRIFSMEAAMTNRMTDRISHLGGTFDRLFIFKHVSLKQSRFYLRQKSTAYTYRMKVDGNVATINLKIFLISLHVIYRYFPDIPRMFGQQDIELGSYCPIPLISKVKVTPKQAYVTLRCLGF